MNSLARLVLYAVAEISAVIIYASIASIWLTLTARPRYKIFFAPVLIVRYMIQSIIAIFQYYKASGNIELHTHKHHIPANASRGPCPFLNTVANHGYIPASGRDVTLAQIMIAMKKTLNIGPIFAYAVTSLNLIFHGHEHPSTFERCLTLSDLGGKNGHMVAEHDASLTRLDSNLGDNTSLNKKMLKDFLSISKDGNSITAEELCEYRSKIESESQKNNPDFTWSFLQRFGAYQEAAFLPVTLGDGKETVPVAVVKSLFEEERFPDNFHPPRKTVEIFDMNSVRYDMMGRANQLTITPKTIIDIFKPWHSLLMAKNHQE